MAHRLQKLWTDKLRGRAREPVFAVYNLSERCLKLPESARKVLFPLFLQQLLKFKGNVEMILNCAFIASRDNQN